MHTCGERTFLYLFCISSSSYKGTNSTRGGGVLASDGSSCNAASRPFWGHHSTAPLPKESAGRSATGNLRSGALPKWGRLKHTAKSSTVRRKESSLCQTGQSLSIWKIGNFTAKGPLGGPSWLQQQQAAHCPTYTEGSAPPAGKLLYVGKAALMRGCGAD